jgi:hypothetical protein
VHRSFLNSPIGCDFSQRSPTVSDRFGLHRFGQGTLLGVYRWLVLSLIAYLLAHWAYLSTATTDLPDWGRAAQLALQSVLPQLLMFLFFT